MKKNQPSSFTATHDLILEYRILVGSVIQALEFYDSDDGHNDLVLLGIVAEHKRLQGAYDKLQRGGKR